MPGKPKVTEESTEVVPVQDVVGTLVKRTGDVLGRWLVSEAENTETDPEAVYTAIINEIMAAGSQDELFNLPEPSKLEDHADRPLEFLGFKMLDSDYDQGAPVYFVIGAIDLQTAKKVIITCGEQAIMAQLFRAQQLELFPVRLIPRQSTRPNRFGRHPMRLHLASA